MSITPTEFIVKLSRRGLYALKALLHLAAAYDRGGVVKIRAIADEEEIPEKFLEAILVLLKNARLVASERGREGGYRLRRPPQEIVLGDVVRLVDGPLAPFGDVVELQRRVRSERRHDNMITINGKKMGRSYNNIIKLTELFSGNHPLLEQSYHPMVVRFYILQTHYRSTLDFSNEALRGAEKGLKRLWEAYEALMKLEGIAPASEDAELEEKVKKLLSELDDFMNDDFNTAKVLANLFELVPVINGIKDKHIAIDAVSKGTFEMLQQYFKLYLEDILGLQNEHQQSGKLSDVLELLVSIRKDARSRKDFATSDKIRDHLSSLGILLKDEKDGDVSYTFI